MTDGVADQGNYVRRLINNDRARARSDQCPQTDFSAETVAAEPPLLSFLGSREYITYQGTVLSTVNIRQQSTVWDKLK